jgi:sugar phosphate isomerase/epimerase
MEAAPWFRISLAQWSLHRTLNAGELDHLDFITATRRDYGIEAVEYVNSFFFERAADDEYLKRMIERCDGEGVRSLLIMCDNEGRIGDPDAAARTKAVENHYKWVHAAAFLGCHSIRVNAASEGDWAEQSRLAADGLHRLATYASALDVNVLVENHGGLSSNAAWLTETIERADQPALGTLPDFGNFRIAEGDWYDIYQGVEELMPMARAVSAKSHDFDDAGNESDKDYMRLLGSVRDAGYRGWIGIEYEGADLPEDEGIRRTKELLERCRAALSA